MTLSEIIALVYIIPKISKNIVSNSEKAQLFNIYNVSIVI
ncbi:hypothetical protein DSUL_60087 [Desulfovibrionales bacterium]